MIKRILEPYLKDLSQQLPVTAILGPRQSGKTTLAQMSFPNHTYISFEDLDMRELAEKDPHGFLNRYAQGQGIILDEFQHVPSILSYIQTYVDKHKVRGFFILTGSQNFLVNQAISQTLAGRIAIFTLLPLSLEELHAENIVPQKLDSILFQGMYPRVYAENVSPSLFYKGYIATYVERDVRHIANVTDLSLFRTFIQLCAGRIGQILDVNSLANDCGITVATVNKWLSLLEASYIIFLLRPHFQNFNKRLIKAPKIYFYDTGLACSILGIESEQQIFGHYARGGLFESFVISELSKNFHNHHRTPRLYFWRDSTGNEIDCILEKPDMLVPIEIKSSATYTSSFFDGIKKWNALAERPEGAPSYLVYGGDDYMELKNGSLVGWKNIKKIS